MSADPNKSEEVNPNLPQNELCQEILQEHPLDDPSNIPPSALLPAHLVKVPLLNQEAKELIQEICGNEMAKLSDKIAELSTHIVEEHQILLDQIKELSRNALDKNLSGLDNTDNTRSRIVELLMRDFRLVMIGTIILIALASFGGQFVDKELIKITVPLLINVVTGLVGGMLGFYFSKSQSKS